MINSVSCTFPYSAKFSSNAPENREDPIAEESLFCEGALYSKAESNGPIFTDIPLAFAINSHCPESNLNSNEKALVEPGLKEVMSSFAL